MCDHFGPSPSTGVLTGDDFSIPWHPHRGMDILTYLIQGIGRHGDSMGNRSTFRSPGMQWISVGSGIEHAEGGGTPASEVMEGFQIWVNVPAEHKMKDPRYGINNPEDIPVLIDYKDNNNNSNNNENNINMKARILSGTVNNLNGPFKTVVDTQMIDFMINKNGKYNHQIPNNLNNCLVYVYKGNGLLNGSPVKLHDIALLDATDVNMRNIELSSNSNDGLNVIVFSGKKINEPIAWHGPFVMNTQNEINQAINEYQSGTFLKKRTAWDYKKLSTFPKELKFDKDLL